MVLGGHGDTMVPLPRHTTVKGRLVSDMMPNDRLEAIVQRTRDGGAEIVGLLKTGSAFYAPSASAVDMVEAIIKDQKRVMPCAVLCEGEYGLRDVVVGVPVQLGKGGAERVIVYDLTPDEQKALEVSAQAVRELCSAVDRLMS
jgi:malate dehydrogenase